MRKVKVGVIGCGDVCKLYLRNMTDRFSLLEVKACADRMMGQAEAKAAEYPGMKALSVEELLADPEIAIVVNLTTPQAHAEVAMRALQAGKHVYGEKPLALTRKEGQRLLAEAKKRNLLLGAAPDTFMGGGIQTCRQVIDQGLIGQPVAATAFFLCRGHEYWHPNPDFYYQEGGGPMFDMGPYYLTALVNLIGPVAAVAGMNRITFPERTITSQPRYGQKVPVAVPTHVTGLMRFQCGAIASIITSFDVWATHLPRVEIHGTEGSLSVPDPNNFGGEVLLRTCQEKEWRPVALSHGYQTQSRGIGVADMAWALLNGEAPRTSAALAYHVLDIMHAFHEAADLQKECCIESTCERPAALSPDEHF